VSAEDRATTSSPREKRRTVSVSAFRFRFSFFRSFVLSFFRSFVFRFSFAWLQPAPLSSYAPFLSNHNHNHNHNNNNNGSPPVALIWCNTETILLAVRQPPAIARLTQEFLWWRLPALPFLAVAETLTNYVKAQRVMVPSMGQLRARLLANKRTNE
jgi:hypothetical protein